MLSFSLGHKSSHILSDVKGALGSNVESARRNVKIDGMHADCVARGQRESMTGHRTAQMDGWVGVGRGVGWWAVTAKMEN